MTDSVIRAAAFASVPVAAALGHLTAIQLYVVAAVYGLFKMISLAGFPALIPSLVPADRLAQANALEGVSFGVASLVGAALAAVVVAVPARAAPVIAFDAVERRGPCARAGVRSAPRPCAGAAVNFAAANSATLLPVVRLALRDPILLTTTPQGAVPVAVPAVAGQGQGAHLLERPPCAGWPGRAQGAADVPVASRKAWCSALAVTARAVQALTWLSDATPRRGRWPCRP